MRHSFGTVNHTAPRSDHGGSTSKIENDLFFKFTETIETDGINDLLQALGMQANGGSHVADVALKATVADMSRHQGVGCIRHRVAVSDGKEGWQLYAA